MPSIITKVNGYPEFAEPGDGYVFDGSHFMRVEPFEAVAQISPNSGLNVHPLEPDLWIESSEVVLVAPDSERHTEQGVHDRWKRQYERLWRYWITTPDPQLPGVRDFVAAAEAGGLPEGWTEKAAQDSAGDLHTLCTFLLTMDGARSLGAEQSALMALADLPEGVFFFQTVAQVDGFTGVERQSRQPTQLETALYEPGDLFQTSHPDAAGQRGSAFGEPDVLDATGLTLT